MVLLRFAFLVGADVKKYRNNMQILVLSTSALRKRVWSSIPVDGLYILQTPTTNGRGCRTFQYVYRRNAECF
jgi:hypothetical protein